MTLVDPDNEATFKRLEFHNDLRAARDASDGILREVESARYSPDAVFAIKLALEEAMTNALKHGKTVRNYGEFMGPSVRWRDAKKKGEPDFTACYNAWKNGADDVVFGCWPSVESLRAVSPADYVG